jgi:deoxyribonuclease-4
VNEKESFRLGCHLSIARGFSAAVERATVLGNNALQIFTHSPSVWRMRPLSDEEIVQYLKQQRTSDVSFVAVHAMYLINLTSPDETLYHRSIRAMIEEIRRAARLDADVVVTHVGHAMGASREAAIERTVEALRHIVSSREFEQAAPVHLVLENTAGSGTAVGAAFDELALLLDGIDDADRVGMCLDTCHATAAGYDLRTEAAVDDTLEQLDRSVGLDRLFLIHLNDALYPVGSRRDRHAHIGRGILGERGIAAVLRHPLLRDTPVILETPKTFDGGIDADPVNLALVRRLRAGVEPTSLT